MFSKSNSKKSAPWREWEIRKMDPFIWVIQKCLCPFPVEDGPVCASQSLFHGCCFENVVSCFTMPSPVIWEPFLKSSCFLGPIISSILCNSLTTVILTGLRSWAVHGYFSICYILRVTEFLKKPRPESRNGNPFLYCSPKYFTPWVLSSLDCTFCQSNRPFQLSVGGKSG